MKLKDNPTNPRKASGKKLVMLRRSMEEYGDLGGVIYNERTGRLVGGHQRLKAFDEDGSHLTITKRFNPPTANGTVAEGEIFLAGVKTRYRVVDWPEKKEKAAMISANRQAGEWDEDGLNDIVNRMKRRGDSLAMVGFTEEEQKELEAQRTELKQNAAVSLEGIKESNLRVTQLFLTVDTHKMFMARMADLMKRYDKDNLTQAVLEALKRETKAN